MSNVANYEPYWMPFSANRNFKTNPRMVESAQGMYYTTTDGRKVLDMAAGLWCSNLGHGRPEIAEAIAKTTRTLDFVPSFNLGHPQAFELAERLAEHAPGNLDRVFFTTSGSEAIDTVLKIALAYQVLRGKGEKRLIISREKAYHGVNFGGTAVGGIAANTRLFGRWNNVDFLPHTLGIEGNRFSRGLPVEGVDRADALLELIALHGAETIACVLVEPIPGAGGMIPPPAGYLRRLRTICDEHDILLIFDEVVCGFGRVGDFTGGAAFDVVPDLCTVAKGLTNGAVPMGAVFVDEAIYATFMNAGSEGIEFWHGYTYSGHPLACAAALACLDIYENEGLLTRASGNIALQMEDILHDFCGVPGIADVRNYALLGAIEFESVPGETIGSNVVAAAWEQGLMVRGLGDTIAISPPLVVQEAELNEFGRKLRSAIGSVLG